MPESSGATSFIFWGERVRAQELYAQVNSHLCLTDRQASERPAIGTAVVRESNLSHSHFSSLPLFACHLHSPTVASPMPLAMSAKNSQDLLF